MSNSTPAARALYRGLWRQVRRFQADAIPITGVVGLDAGPVCIDPLARLRAAFRQGAAEAPSRNGSNNGNTTTNHQRLSEGLRALRALPHQAAALEHAEEDARALLARWAELQARWAALRRQGRQGRSAAAEAHVAINTRVLEAGEEACALAYAATEEQAAERALDDDEADEIRLRARRVLSLAEPRPRAEAAADLAERARGAAALAAEASSTSSSLSSRYPSVRVRAAAAASAALFAHDGGGGGGGEGASSSSNTNTNTNTNTNNSSDGGRLRFEPVEWVYDGIEAALSQPLLAGETAHAASASSGGTSSGPPSRAARKGVPLALALAAARCLADAGLPGLARCEPVSTCDRDAEMLAAGRAEQRGSAGGDGSGLAALPPAVAARQAGRTVAVAPATNTWLVRLDVFDGDGGSASTPTAWFVDVTKSGELLSAEEAKGRYPLLDVAPSSLASSSTAEEEEEEERATLALWREVARTLVLAHQRRGEADAVAGWMRAAMALDPAAGEWGRALGGGGGGGGGA